MEYLTATPHVKLETWRSRKQQKTLGDIYVPGICEGHNSRVQWRSATGVRRRGNAFQLLINGFNSSLSKAKW